MMSTRLEAPDSSRTGVSFTLNHMLSPTAEAALLTEDTGQGLGVVAPSRVAERLNRQFPMDRTRQYFTLVDGVFDQAHGRFSYVMVGHPSAIGCETTLCGRGSSLTSA